MEAPLPSHRSREAPRRCASPEVAGSSSTSRSALLYQTSSSTVGSGGCDEALTVRCTDAGRRMRRYRHVDGHNAARSAPAVRDGRDLHHHSRTPTRLGGDAPARLYLDCHEFNGADAPGSGTYRGGAHGDITRLHGIRSDPDGSGDRQPTGRHVSHHDPTLPDYGWERHCLSDYVRNADDRAEHDQQLDVYAERRG